MKIIRTVSEMKNWSKSRLAKGKTIGLVPTMGYLHEGHLTLMRRSAAENSFSVASIFVNPTQFGPNEDLEKYPRDPDSDAKKCSNAGIDAIFMPAASEVYSPGHQTYVDLEKVASPLCGASRPGHFRGVATVVLKLFNIIAPAKAYFGQKDYQQLQVVTTMVKDLNLETEIVPCPTVREPDGLAMSSRNSYLSENERKQAVCLYEALMAGKELFKKGEQRPERYIQVMSERIHAEPDTRPDYISLVHPETLEDLREVNERCLGVLAVRIGQTRLIDNMIFE